eukprot:5389252-Alexandrium_andersonii.AAC.1
MCFAKAVLAQCVFGTILPPTMLNPGARAYHATLRVGARGGGMHLARLHVAAREQRARQPRACK